MSDAEQKPNIESDELRKRIVDGLHKHYVRINDYDGPVVRAMVKTCEEIIKANQPTPPTPKPQAVQGDDWLRRTLSEFYQRQDNRVVDNGLNHEQWLEAAIQAQIDEAVREARKEERRLLQRELDRLQQFQESVINREALRTGPVVVCAGCAKQLTTQPKPSKEGSDENP